MKDKILLILRKLYHSLKLVFNILLSLIRIMSYSRSKTRSLKLCTANDTLFILGNGPSVKQLLKEQEQILSIQDLVVVNDFFLSEYFTKIKPHIYIIADPGYWKDNVSDSMLELRQKMENTFINDICWDLLFFVPTEAYKTGFFQETYRSNPNVHVQAFNDTQFIGPKRLRYWFYDKLLAMPLSGNIIGKAISITLQMNIKKIYLFGVEHSWTRSLYVDDQNRTCIESEHFYTETKQGTVWLKSNSQPYTISEALFDIATMLGGYREINDYAIQKGVKIYNCTPDSFIDAFERKYWTNFS